MSRLLDGGEGSVSSGALVKVMGDIPVIADVPQTLLQHQRGVGKVGAIGQLCRRLGVCFPVIVVVAAVILLDWLALASTLRNFSGKT